MFQRAGQIRQTILCARSCLKNGLKAQIDAMLGFKSSLLVDLITRIGLVQSCENLQVRDKMLSRPFNVVEVSDLQVHVADSS